MDQGWWIRVRDRGGMKKIFGAKGWRELGLGLEDPAPLFLCPYFSSLTVRNEGTDEGRSGVWVGGGVMLKK